HDNDSYQPKLAIKLYNRRHLDYTRSAPRGPKIQKHDMAAIIGQVDFPAIERLQEEIGSQMSHLRRLRQHGIRRKVQVPDGVALRIRITGGDGKRQEHKDEEGKQVLEPLRHAQG